jgi:hypothetical protein
MNILELPTEIIEEILSYVPDNDSVSLTCNKFNEVNSKIKFFTLDIFIDECCHGTKVTNLFHDDEAFKFVTQSSLRFNKLNIRNYFGFFKEVQGVQLERLTQIIERFGKDIQELHVHLIELPSNFVELLNFMPNLKIITFQNVMLSNSGTFAEGELKLFKLKKFISYECSTKVLGIFKQHQAFCKNFMLSGHRLLQIKSLSCFQIKTTSQRSQRTRILPNYLTEVK